MQKIVQLLQAVTNRQASDQVIKFFNSLGQNAQFKAFEPVLFLNPDESGEQVLLQGDKNIF